MKNEVARVRRETAMFLALFAAYGIVLAGICSTVYL